MTLNDFVVFAQANGQASAKFFAKFEESDIYVGISKIAGKIRGRLMLMKESNNQIVILNREGLLLFCVLCQMKNNNRPGKIRGFFIV